MARVSCSVDKIDFCKEIAPEGDVIILVLRCQFLCSRWESIFYLKSFFREAACAVTNSNNVFWRGVYETLVIFSRARSARGILGSESSCVTTETLVKLTANLLPHQSNEKKKGNKCAFISSTRSHPDPRRLLVIQVQFTRKCFVSFAVANIYSKLHVERTSMKTLISDRKYHHDGDVA